MNASKLVKPLHATEFPEFPVSEVYSNEKLQLNRRLCLSKLILKFLMNFAHKFL